MWYGCWVVVTMGSGWWWTLLPLVILGVNGKDCPSQCSCFLNYGPALTVTVDCHGRDLSAIPSPLPKATSHLDLSNNFIQTVSAADFLTGTTGIIHLCCFAYISQLTVNSSGTLEKEIANKPEQLQNNDLLSIEPMAFQTLPLLETLLLYNNYQLEQLNATFDGLFNLRKLVAYNIGLQTLSPSLLEPLLSIVELDFSFNQLKQIPSGTFSDLHRLKTLLLNNNFISSLEPGSFTNLTSLAYLCSLAYISQLTVNSSWTLEKEIANKPEALNHNQIQEVPAQTFVGLDQLHSIVLVGNPIQCTCSVLYLQQFLLDQRLSGPPCEGPQEFKGRMLLELNSEEFCEHPTAVIVSPSAPLVVPATSAFQINCSVTGIPLPVITWSRDGQTLVANGSRVVIKEGTLLVSETQRSDSGTYHCSASSSAGLASTSLQVLVLDRSAASLNTAMIRNDVVLMCGSQELPAGTPVVWLFNQSRLGPVSAKHVVVENGSLLVREVQFEDMGDYVCQVGGQVNMTQTLIITARPEIISINQGRCNELNILRIDSDAIESMLHCAAFGIPPPIVRWTLNGVVLDMSVPDDDMEVGVVEVRHTLGRPLISGNYTCTASNSVGNVSIMRTVIIRNIMFQNAGDVVILMHFAGDTVIMDCPVQGFMFEEGSTFSWSRNDQLPLPLDRANFTCENRTLILRRAVSTDDISLYNCQVQEPSGRRFQFSVFLTLFERPAIERECGMEVVVGMVGGVVQLRCPATGFPMVTTEWKREGRGEDVLIMPPRITILSDDLSDRQLQITSLDLEDSGLYTCTVSNEILGQDENDSYTIRLVVQNGPRFLSVPVNVSVVMGGRVQLPCSGSGSPTPSITWWRQVGGSPVSQVITDGKYFVAENFLLLTLVSPQIDEGTYYCNLTSSAGTVTSDSVYVDVLTLPVLDSIRQSYIYKTGSVNATLTCSGLGDPLPEISWFRLPHVTVLIPTENLTNYVRDGNDLVISNVSVEDEGTYRCLLANIVGQVFLDIQVIVKAPPNTSVEPSSLAANVGCQVIFRCLDGGRPPGDFQWLLNDVPVQTRSGLIVSATGELLLSDLKVQDTGNYSCTVRGTLQDTTSTAVLTVEDPIFASGSQASPPTIFSPTLSRQILAVQQSVQFVCLVEGLPSPRVVWLRDGKSQPNFRRVTNLNESLSIRALRVTDSATYECVASNALGEEREAFQLVVGVHPFVIRHPLPQVLSEGQDLSLLCTAGGYPLPNITWLMNNIEIVPSEKHLIGQNSTSLTVRNVSMAMDAGTYTCLTENFVGVARHSSLISIIEFTSVPVIILDPPSNQLVMEGASVILRCRALGKPEPELEWMSNNQELPFCPPGGGNISSACVGEDMVVIPSMSESDKGNYSCMANNSAGIAVYSILLSLAPIPRSLPVFLVSPMPQWVANQSEFTLDCVTGGLPSATILWELNGLVLNLSSVGVNLHENGSLTITEASAETVGLFACVAENGVGISQSLVQVDILATEEIMEAAATAPVVTSSPLGMVSLLPGQSAVLDCSASGNPSPSISWTRNGQAINFASLPTIEIASNGSLILTEVTGAEKGNYSCKAVNQAGTSELSFFLDIEEDGIVSGSSAMSLPSSLSVLSGSRLLIHCNVSMAAAPGGRVFVWRYEDRVLCSEHEGNGSLLLSPVLLEHAGMYKCQALHNTGILEGTFTLDVLPRREPPFFVVEPEDGHVVKRGFLLLPCRAASSGGEETQLSWFHAETALVKKGIRHLILENGSLLLVNVRLSQAGNYSCQASNMYGHSISTAQVFVSRSKVNKVVYAREGSTVLLSCDLRGSDVKWVKDGRDTVTSHNGSVWLFQISQSYEGEYTCSILTDSFNYLVTVQVPPRILRTSMIVNVLKGFVVSLHCVAAGKPKPNLTWHHGGLQLERGQRHSVLANGTLLVYGAERKDEGVYLCRATNIQGSVEARLLLLVTG